MDEGSTPSEPTSLDGEMTESGLLCLPRKQEGFQSLRGFKSHSLFQLIEASVPELAYGTGSEPVVAKAHLGVQLPPDAPVSSGTRAAGI